MWYWYWRNFSIDIPQVLCIFLYYLGHIPKEEIMIKDDIPEIVDEGIIRKSIIIYHFILIFREKKRITPDICIIQS